jgi:hypothetical protein
MTESARDALAYAAGALTPARKVGELLDAYRDEVLAAERAVSSAGQAPTPDRAAVLREAAAELGGTSGPGWYEVINPRDATTCIALVYEDGSLYLPEGEDVLTEEAFAFAAARGQVHRLARVDELRRMADEAAAPDRPAVGGAQQPKQARP